MPKHTFDISVQFLVGMEIIQTAEKLPQNDGDVFFMDHTWPQQTMATAARTEFHDDPQVGSLQVRAMIFGDIGGFQLGQYGDFPDDIIDIILRIFNIDDLDGHGFTGASIHTAIDQPSQ